MYNLRLLTILLTISCCSCAHSIAHNTTASEIAKPAVESSPPTVNNSSQQAIKPPSEDNRLQKGSIRATDFKNFVYPWYPKGYRPSNKERKVTLRDGEMLVEKIPDKNVEAILFSLANVSYADLTNDDTEEAIVTLTANFDPNGSYSCTFVYALENGDLKILWKQETQDRAYGGLRSIRVQDGNLVIEKYNSKFGENETAMCCPKTFVRAYYRWDGRHFQQIKSETLPNEYEDSRFLGYPNASP